MKEVPVAIREHCYVCRRAKKHCLCDSIKPFATRTHFVILMHVEEARKQKTGTGWLAKKCLKNAELLVGANFAENERVNALLSDPSYIPFVLYPGTKAVSFGSMVSDFVPADKTLLVFVVDGTWRTARSTLNKSPNIRALPRLSFDGRYISQFAIKKQPMRHCLSTIEAIYYLCREAEEAGYEKPNGQSEILMTIFKKMVDTQLGYSMENYRRRKDNKQKD